MVHFIIIITLRRCLALDLLLAFPLCITAHLHVHHSESYLRYKGIGFKLRKSSVERFVFFDMHSFELSTTLASSLVSGFGEHYTHLTLVLNWTSVTLWNRDMAPHSDADLYGSHPFCLVQEGDGQSYGIFLLNSNAMDIIGRQLNSGTLCMTSQKTMSSYYNLHGLYGLTVAIATYRFLQCPTSPCSEMFTVKWRM